MVTSKLSLTWTTAVPAPLLLMVDLVADAYHFDQYDMRTWEENGRLLPQLIAVIRLAEGVRGTSRRSLTTSDVKPHFDKLSAGRN